MFRAAFVGFSRMFMSLRECTAAGNSAYEISEQTVADLNQCLDGLESRIADTNRSIDDLSALVEAQGRMARSERGPARERAIMQAKHLIADRRRQTAELMRLQRSERMLRLQVTTLVNSHLDGAIIEAMRQYCATATRLGLPNRSEDVQMLSNELEEVVRETNQFQSSLAEMSNAFAAAPFPGCLSMEDEEEALQHELDALLASPEPAPSPAAVQDLPAPVPNLPAPVQPVPAPVQPVPAAVPDPEPSAVVIAPDPQPTEAAPVALT